MRARFAFVSIALVLYACIDSPTVELVGTPDAATTATPAPSPSPDATPSSTSTSPPPPPAPCDQRKCASAGGTCTSGSCTFQCEGESEGACAENIKCPPGMPCTVNCVGKEACENTIECREATSCTIHCDGEDACKQGVVCMGPQCAITCTNKGCSVDEIRCCASVCTLNGAAAICP